MTNSAKMLLRKIPGVTALIRKLSYYKTIYYIRKNRFQTPEELFTDYYKKKFWGTKESASGHGSTVQYTEKVRKGIEALIKTHSFKSILDAPCGDYNWFQHVQRGPDVQYMGGDIVKELIHNNNESFGSPNTRFFQLDIINEKIPDADIWICRDVLFHFSYQDIKKTLQNFLDSNIPYLLTTSHTQHDANKDIITGNYRLLNLEMAPFNFSKPITRIDDWIEGYPVRHMCLWHKDDIKKLINNMAV